MNKNNQKNIENVDAGKEYITVVMVEPGKLATSCRLGTTLEELQEAVKGYIETFYPVPEAVCYVCNEEGKLNGMRPNRAIYNETGNLVDILCGPFFICGVSGGEFVSLTQEQVARFTEKYRLPEVFVQLNGKIVALPYMPATPQKRGEQK